MKKNRGHKKQDKLWMDEVKCFVWQDNANNIEW